MIAKQSASRKPRNPAKAASRLLSSMARLHAEAKERREAREARSRLRATAPARQVPRAHPRAPARPRAALARLRAALARPRAQVHRAPQWITPTTRWSAREHAPVKIAITSCGSKRWMWTRSERGQGHARCAASTRTGGDAGWVHAGWPVFPGLWERGRALRADTERTIVVRLAFV